MEYLYKENYEFYRNSLVQLRQEEKEDYQTMIIYNLFYNLSPLNKMFNEIDKEFFTGKMKAIDIKDAVQKTLIYKKKILDGLQQFYSTAWTTFGVPIYHLNSNQFKGKIVNKTNTQVEELEFTYITYMITADLITNWASLGMLGYSKSTAFKVLATDIQVAFDEKSFESIFNAFMQQALFRLVGVKNSKGEQLTQNTLYKPLPEFYNHRKKWWPF